MRGTEGESDESGQPSPLPEGEEASAHGNERIGVTTSNSEAVPHSCFLLISGVTAECHRQSWLGSRPYGLNEYLKLFVLVEERAARDVD